MGNPIINRVPNFLAASTPKRLERLMLSNNLKHQCEFKYFDIRLNGTKWYAWFYLEIDLSKKVNEAVRGK